MGWRTAADGGGLGGEGVLAPTEYEWGNGGEGGSQTLGRFFEMWESHELIPHLKFRTSRRLGIGQSGVPNVGRIDFGRAHG